MNQTGVMPDLFHDIRLFAFDLDGTLYHGEQAIEGAHATVSGLQSRFQVVFFTNNSTKSKRQIFAKLNRLGFVCQLEDVYTAASSTAVFLREAGLDRVYLIGSQGLADEILAHGVTLAPAEIADVVVVGLDTEFNYPKIADALAILRRGGRFVVCNEDAAYPVEEGRWLPGCGAMVGAIRGSSGRVPDIIVGKPDIYMLREMANARHLEPHQIVVVGDSWPSDIQMANRYGSPAIWIQIGEEPISTTEGVVRVRDHATLQHYCQVGQSAESLVAN